MLQLLKNLRSHSQGKEITDGDILNWANDKVKKSGRTSVMESFKVILRLLLLYRHHVCMFINTMDDMYVRNIRIKAYQLEFSSYNF